MIRKFDIADMDNVLDIWLSASINAHNFIASDFWRSQLNNMRSLYLPNATVYLFEQQNEIKGFYALHEQNLAALFVAPLYQGKGSGSQLLEHALSLQPRLSLTVYKENGKSVAFYLKHNFTPEVEQLDPHTGHLEILMSNTKKSAA